MNANTWGKQPVPPMDDAARAHLLASATDLVRDAVAGHAFDLEIKSLRRSESTTAVAFHAVKHNAATKAIRSASDVAYLPSAQPTLVLVTAAPNGPNTSPTAHLINAVGLGGHA